MLLAALAAPSVAAETQYLTGEPARGHETSRPNVVVVVLDDMGFSDLGCYGAEVRTPNIDRLAESGLRFTRFYNASRCCPTCAALLTGLYPHQLGLARDRRDLSQGAATMEVRPWDWTGTIVNTGHPGASLAFGLPGQLGRHPRGTDENRAASPSAIVGWVSMASRNAV
jgi:Sulfatase